VLQKNNTNFDTKKFHSVVNTIKLAALKRIGGDDLIAVGEDEFDFGKLGFSSSVSALTTTISDATFHVDHVSRLVFFTCARPVFGYLSTVALDHFVGFVKQPKNVVAVGVEHTVVTWAIGHVVCMSQYVFGAMFATARRVVD